MTAAFDAQYGMELPTGLNAETEEMLMIAPLPCVFIGAATRLSRQARQYTPLTFTASTLVPVGLPSAHRVLPGSYTA